MTRTEFAERLSALLDLDSPPIGLAFVNARPADVAVAESVVPSSCAFWRQAEREVFYAPAEGHFNCPVGAMVMGFELPAEVTDKLGGLVKAMGDARYLDPAEAGKIPHMTRRSTGMVYGPYGRLPVEPDLVMMWLEPCQAMIFNEAAGGASRMAEPLGLSGRPGCSAIPLALEGNRPQMSLGCVGMRVFTEISGDRLLGAVPARRLGGFVASLETVTQANAILRSHYEEHKASIG